MQAEQTMEIGVSILTGGSFHTRHICLKGDRAKIADAHLTIDVSRRMKAETK